MSEASFASLGPTLLARKGGAKPAMRPQLGPLPETASPQEPTDEQLEDLGWNDMGADDAAADMPAEAAPTIPATKPKRKTKSKGANIVSINAAPRVSREAAAKSKAAATKATKNKAAKSKAAKKSKAALMTAPQPANEPANEDAQTSAPLIKAKPARTNSAKAESKKPSTQTHTKKQGKRAAFTLRLDAERHLKLRLAATLQGVSAQALVTEALDGMLNEIGGLDTLVASMTPRMKRH